MEYLQTINEKLDQLKKQLKCHKCGKSIYKGPERGCIQSKYCLECSYDINRKRSAINNAIRKGMTTVECVMCGKKLPIVGNIPPKLGMCTKCIKREIDLDYDLACKIAEIKGNPKPIKPSPSARSLRPITPQVEEDDDRLISPHLRGKTAKERQEIAYRTYIANRQEPSWMRHKPEPPVFVDDDLPDENHPLADLLPSRRVKKKPQKVPKCTAPVGFRNTTNPETGQEFVVEVRGTGFYGVNSHWR